jgi:hypothetical protein
MQKDKQSEVITSNGKHLMSIIKTGYRIDLHTWIWISVSWQNPRSGIHESLYIKRADAEGGLYIKLKRRKERREGGRKKEKGKRETTRERP